MNKFLIQRRCLQGVAGVIKENHDFILIIAKPFILAI